MSGRNNPGNPTDDGDLVDRLSQMSDRTNLMILEATLKSLPQNGAGYAAAAAEVRSLARRMLDTARDYRASLDEAG
jgi:hypothetical protein